MFPLAEASLVVKSAIGVADTFLTVAVFLMGLSFAARWRFMIRVFRVVKGDEPLSSLRH